jgi:hypothetical protein
MADTAVSDGDIENLRARICIGKRRYDAMGDARRAANRTERESYWCHFCGWYHTRTTLAWRTVELLARAIRQGRLPSPERAPGDGPYDRSRPVRPLRDTVMHHNRHPRRRPRRGRTHQSD